MENLSLAQICMLLFGALAVLCLVAPRFLFCAHPDKKKRLHGVLFPFFTSLVIGGVINTFTMLRSPQMGDFLACGGFVLAWIMYFLFLRRPAAIKQILQKNSENKNEVDFKEKWCTVVEKAKVNEERRKAAVALEKKKQKRVTAYSQTSDREYTVLPYFVECSCPDWQKKRSEGHGPFALCKHLVSHYVTYPDDTPEDIQPFQKILLHFAIAEKGIPPAGKVADYGEIEGMAYFFTGYADSLPWVNVYTDISGDERYGYNIQTKRWAKGEEPFHSKELEVAIEAAL